MAQEIERKFLVQGEYKSYAYAHSHIVQGYISSARGRTVRVRIRDEKARELMTLCEPGVIDKTRYLVKSGDHVFEIDEFYGDNEGLVMAEVELSQENESFVKPHFIGEEVTGDIRYYNPQLMKKPFKSW